MLSSELSCMYLFAFACAYASLSLSLVSWRHWHLTLHISLEIFLLFLVNSKEQRAFPDIL